MESCEKVCRLNLTTGRVKVYDSLETMSIALGNSVQHCRDIIKNTTLVKGSFVFYFISEVFNERKRLTNHYRVKLPKRHIQKIVAAEREKFTRKLQEGLKNYYPDKFKGLEVYLINIDGEIKGMLEGLGNVAKFFSIKEGTVKSRLSRINSLEKAKKYGMCKKSVFEKLKK